jgi:IS1 family transposase
LLHILEVTPKTVRAWCASGILPATSNGYGSKTTWQMGFVCGVRTATTLKSLVAQIDKDFEPDGYCGDGWRGFPIAVGAGRLLVGKEWTCPVAKNNALTKQGPVRFHRKTHAYSKSPEMVSLPLKDQIHQPYLLPMLRVKLLPLLG